jgi:colanic acid/amylovoran biosynthesis glycosyltransferase
VAEVEAPLRHAEARPRGQAGEAMPSFRGPLLYVAGTVPKLSETFVYREILELRARGVEVRVASVHAPERRLGDSRLDALAAEVIPIYSAGWARLLRDAGSEVMRRPVRGTRTLLLALRDALLAQDIGGVRRPKVLWQAVAGLALAQRCRGEGVRHIHAHMAHVPTTIAMYAARQLRAPFSFTGHANDLFPNRALLKEKLERAAFAASISHWHREFYLSVAPGRRLELPVVRCGVEMAPRVPRRESPEFTIIGVGRLIAKKGFDVLLGAVAELRRQRPEVRVRCQIIGEGPEGPRLREIVRAKGLQEVVDLAGPMANSEVLRALEHADLFVLPCKQDKAGDRDGIPVVLMEAMARGVCVISGDLPTIRELVKHGETGLLAPPEDEGALSAAIQALIDDPGLRQRLAEKGRAWVDEEFSARVNIDRLLDAFVVAGKDAHPCAA